MPDIFKKRCTVLSGHPEKCPKIKNTASLSQGRLSRIGAKNEWNSDQVDLCEFYQ